MAFATPKNDIIQLQLASAYTAGAGSLVLKTGQGANFTTFPCYVTVISNPTYATGAAEVKAAYVVTGKSTDTLTGVSVIDGYTDINFAINDYVEERINAKYITDLNSACSTSILTVNTETAVPNSRKIVLATGLTPTDGGAGGNYTITPAFASLTTTGSSGSATLSGGVLNVPTYTGGGGGGTVTTVSVASANGFAGTVANATSTPAITISTSITGILVGNGTAIAAATQMSQGASGELIQAAIAQPGTLVAGARWYDSTQLAEGTYRNGIVGYTPRLIYRQVAPTTQTNLSGSNSIITTTNGIGGLISGSNLSFPAGFFNKYGKGIKVSVSGYVTSAAGANNVALYVQLGSTVIGTTATLARTVSLTDATNGVEFKIFCTVPGGAGVGTLNVSSGSRGVIGNINCQVCNGSSIGTQAPQTPTVIDLTPAYNIIVGLNTGSGIDTWVWQDATFEEIG